MASQDGAIFASIRDDSQGWTWEPATAAGTMPSGEWAHVTATFDKTNGAVKIYYNAGLAMENALDLFTTYSTSNAWSLGSRSPAQPDHNLNGLLDDVRIYSGLLSAQQIFDIFMPEPTTQASGLASDTDHGMPFAGIAWLS